MHVRRLPSFPWDGLTRYADIARAHPDGLVDLSVGTPVDPAPDLVQQALRAATNAPGYPTTHGTFDLRVAAVRWMARGLGVADADPDAVLPVIGAKELVASLPGLLGLGPGDQVAIPAVAYPTYEVGALLAGAEPIATEDPTRLDSQRLRLVWLNSPANPTGQVLPAGYLREVVSWARQHGVLVASDECYIELGWEAQPTSVLHPEICGGSPESLLAVHSLSKRSNLAGYRGAFVAGDVQVVRQLLEVRKHTGMMMPAPIQAAMVAALDDDEHVAGQRSRYVARRAILRSALAAAGFAIDHSEAGLYLWVTREEPCWETVRALAELGILVAPGDFYGPLGRQHVRVALTAPDECIQAAADRLDPKIDKLFP